MGLFGCERKSEGCDAFEIKNCNLFTMETVRLYHFCVEAHSIGEVVPNRFGECSRTYSEGDDLRKKTIDCFDDYISQKYPNYVLRKHAVYAFDKASYAKRFGDSLCRQLKIDSGHIYEIEMEASYKGPFALVNRMKQALGNSDQEAKVLEEYFNPKEKWKVYEYLGKEFVVIDEVKQIPSTFDFDIDYDLDKRLFEPKTTWAERMRKISQEHI